MTTPSERPGHDAERCATGEQCFGCHIQSVRIGTPRDFSSRTPNHAPPRTPDNSYAKAVPVMERPGGTVMPFLRADGNVMHQREYDAKRHQIDAARRQAHNASAATSTER